MTCLKRRAVGARVSRGGLAAMAVMMLAGGVQGADLKSEIQSLGADWYWPLENARFSVVQGTAGAEFFEIREEDGANVRDASYPNAVTAIPGVAGNATPDYLPMLPPHATVAPGSSASLLSELSGNTPDAKRLLILQDDQALGGDEPQYALGMFHNTEAWTAHILVSQDPLAPDDVYETVLYIGSDQDDFLSDPPDPLAFAIKLEVKRTGTMSSTYRLTRTAQGVSRQITVDAGTLSDSNASGRNWHQVVMMYTGKQTGSPYLDPEYGNQRLVLKVQDTDGTITTNTVVNNNDTSPGWITYNTESRFIIGGEDDIDGTPRLFHGAVHHLAFWEHALSVAERDDLFGSFESAPTSIAESVVDWDMDLLRFNIWTTPVNDYTTDGTTVPDTLPSGYRDMSYWSDPFWARDDVYPMVRFRFNDPLNPAEEYNAPGSTIPVDSTVTDVGDTAYAGDAASNWIDYLSKNVALLGISKALNDDPGYTLFMQNWGNSRTRAVGQPLEIYYTDDGQMRSLLRNWRDTPRHWRENEWNAADTARLSKRENEHFVPFYREGLSSNAYRTSEFFLRLKSNLDAGSLPLPTRLHMDIEGSYSTPQSLTATGSGQHQGWWSTAIGNNGSFGVGSIPQETRHNSTEYWAKPDQKLKDLADDLSVASLPVTNKSYFDIANEPYNSLFNRFAADQYEFAIFHALVQPARDYLNPTIRASEYGLRTVGEVGMVDEYPVHHTTDFLEDSLDLLDFSAPVLYPLRGIEFKLRTTTSDPVAPHTVRPYITATEWFDRIRFPSPRPGVSEASPTDYDPPSDPADDNSITGLEDPTSSDPLDDAEVVNEFLDNLYVELSKCRMNAVYMASGADSGKPVAPWIPYPGELVVMTRSYTHDNTGYNTWGGDYPPLRLFDHLPDDEYIISWEEVARIAVFSYRRGVREFSFWGADGTVTLGGSTLPGDVARVKQNIEDLEKVIVAVQNAKLSRWDVTTCGASSRTHALFGVPDGLITYDDYIYLGNRIGAADLEGDLTGEIDDFPTGFPDGMVTNGGTPGTDSAYLVENFPWGSVDTCP